MAFRFLYDRPSIVTDGLGRRAVCYLAYNSFSQYNVSVCSDMEIEVKSYDQSMDHKKTFAAFYTKGQFPFRWGRGCYSSRVEKEQKYTYTDLMLELSKFETEALSEYYQNNIREALSWPTGQCTLDFIKLTADNDLTIHRIKSMSATLIVQSTKATELDQCFVELHKKIVMEAATRGFEPDDFPGWDLISEVATLQCARLMSAYPFDVTSCGHSDAFICCLMRNKSLYKRVHGVMIGNQKWTPVQGTTVLQDPPISISFSDESDSEEEAAAPLREGEDN